MPPRRRRVAREGARPPSPGIFQGKEHLLLELTRWSAKYDARSNALEAFVKALRRRDREGVIDRIRAGWKEDEED